MFVPPPLIEINTHLCVKMNTTLWVETNFYLCAETNIHLLETDIHLLETDIHLLEMNTNMCVDTITKVQRWHTWLYFPAALYNFQIVQNIPEYIW